jgi:hypothetical protein
VAEKDCSLGKNEGARPGPFPKGMFSDFRQPVLKQDWAQERPELVTKGNKKFA